MISSDSNAKFSDNRKKMIVLKLLEYERHKKKLYLIMTFWNKSELDKAE